MPAATAPDREKVFAGLIGDEKLFRNYPDFELD